MAQVKSTECPVWEEILEELTALQKVEMTNMISTPLLWLLLQHLFGFHVNTVIGLRMAEYSVYSYGLTCDGLQ